MSREEILGPMTLLTFAKLNYLAVGIPDIPYVVECCFEKAALLAFSDLHRRLLDKKPLR